MMVMVSVSARMRVRARVRVMVTVRVRVTSAMTDCRMNISTLCCETCNVCVEGVEWVWELVWEWDKYVGGESIYEVGLGRG